MPKYKHENFVSISDLTRLTGKHINTMKPILKDQKMRKEGLKHMYNSVTALPLIYEYHEERLVVSTDMGASPDDFRDEENGVFSYNREKGRLAHYKANIEMIKEQDMRKVLISAEVVESLWVSLITTFRSKMLSLPATKCAELAEEDDVSVISAILTQEIENALSDLSNEVLGL